MPRPSTKGLPRRPQPLAKRRQRLSSLSTWSGGIYYVQFWLFELSPGSPAARAFGCSCPQHDGTELFACKRECSVHDLELLTSALDETFGRNFEFDRT